MKSRPIVALVAAGLFAAGASAFGAGNGCMLAGDYNKADAKRVKNFLGDPAQGGGGSLRPRTTSGDPALDAAVGRIVADLSAAFLVRPDFYLVDDVDAAGKPAPNAYALPFGGWAGQSPDGTVLLGKNFLRNEVGDLERFGEKYPDRAAQDRAAVTVRGVLAHEFAHVVQFKAFNVHYTPYMELGADRLAGWYLRRYALAAGSNPDSQERVADCFSRLGDTAFDAPQHHGTHVERRRAFESGVQDHSEAVNPAYRSTLNYLLGEMPRPAFLRHLFPDVDWNLPANRPLPEGHIRLGDTFGLDSQFGVFHRGTEGVWVVDWKRLDERQQGADLEAYGRVKFMVSQAEDSLNATPPGPELDRRRLELHEARRRWEGLRLRLGVKPEIR